MKKKINVLLISLALFIICGVSQVFGYNLKFEAKPADDGYVEFYTSVVASQHAKNTFGNGTPLQTWLSLSQSQGNYTHGTATDHYDVMGILFHSDYGSNYASTPNRPIDSNGYYFLSNKNVVYYDTYGGVINDDNKTSYIDSTGQGTALVTKKTNFNSSNSYYIPYDNSRFKMDFTVSNNKVIYRYSIASSVIEELKQKGLIVNDEVKFSFVTKASFTGEMYTAADFYDNIFKGNQLDTLRNYIAEYEKLDRTYENWSDEDIEKIPDSSARATAKEAKEATKQKRDAIRAEIERLKNEFNLDDDSATLYWGPGVKGCDFGGGFKRGYSSVNDYDNILKVSDAGGEKIIYVNYAEDDGSGKLKEIKGVVPKDRIVESKDINLQFIHAYSDDNKNNWSDLVLATPEGIKSEIEKEHEKYTFTKLSSKNYGKFIRMSEDELFDETGVKYKYEKMIVYEGDSKDTYDTLWKKVQENKGEESNKEVKNLAIANSKPCIVTFVYTPGKQRNIFVNYVKEKEDKSLVELLAPKLDKESESDQGIHEYSLTGSWLDLLSKYQNVSPEYDRYEEYVFTNLKDHENRSLKAKFIRMSEDEINGRLGLYLTEDDEVENGEELAYKYLGLKYCSDKKGTSYERLLEINKSSALKKSKNIIFNVPNNENSTLVSFVYKAPKVEKINVEIVHQNKTTSNLMPIAGEGHTLSAYKTREISWDNEHAYYKIDGKTGKSTATVTITSWEQNEVTYQYLNKIKVEYFYGESDVPAQSNTKSGGSVTLDIKSIINNGYSNVKITYLYGVDAEDSNDEFTYCAFLNFRSSLSGVGKVDCDKGAKGQILLECEYCYDGSGESKPNTELLKVPTDTSLQANLYAHGYTLEELKQLVSLKAENGEVEKQRSEYKLVRVDKDAHSIEVTKTIEKKDQNGNVIKDDNGNAVTEDVKEIEFRDHYEYEGPFTKSNPNAAATIAENMKYVGITVPLLGVPAVIDLGDYVRCANTKCPYCDSGGISKYWIHGFVNVSATLIPYSFKAYYLTDATLNNFNGDSTKLVGSGRENVIGTSDEIEFSVPAQFGNLQNYIGIFDGERSLRGLQFMSQSVTYKREMLDVGSFSKWSGASYLSGLAGNNLDTKGSKNASAKQYFLSDSYAINGDKYNGERLSIAKLHYSNWTRIAKNFKTEGLITIGTSGYGMTSYASSSQIEAINKIQSQVSKQLADVREAAAKRIAAGEDDEGCDDPNVPTTDGIGVAYEDQIGTKRIEKYSDTNGVNIVNPATLKSIKVETADNLVAHTVGSNTTFNLQVGAETIVTPELAESDMAYGTLLSVKERKNYIKYYMYKFNFPVIVNGRTYNSNTPIVVEVSGEGDSDLLDGRGTLRFTPTGSNSIRGSYTTSDVDIRHDEIYVSAVTKNVPNESDAISLFEEALRVRNYFGIGDKSTICSDDNIETTRNTASSVLTGLSTLIRDDARYLSNMVYVQSTNISRVYDFKVTDCTDVNFKNVFRKDSTTTAGVSEHTGKVYFSGIRKLDIFKNTYSPNDENMILPLGPYKQPGGYVEAPKIGYRISFDLKTSGYYDFNSTTQKRTIVIFPELYYISKDGKIFNTNVDAYYKNSSNKYVKLAQAKDYTKQAYYNAINNKIGGYQITYTPNDGYRNVLNLGITSITDMFKAEKKTLDMASIVLNKEMMCTNNDGFVQSWYGEYKLPNSTILVEKGETDLNKQLKDGYLGVIFHIGVVEQVVGSGESIVVISYDTSDKNQINQTNTTQWDYEGYIKFSNPGSVVSSPLKLQLAKGIWSIDDATYQKMKGTVVLYDLDNRAASDFD